MRTLGNDVIWRPREMSLQAPTQLRSHDGTCRKRRARREEKSEVEMTAEG